MGVLGLFSYVQNYVDVALEWHKLCNCKIIIDGNNMAYDIFNNCRHLNPAFGGDYDKYEIYVEDVLKKFQKCNVKPYIIMDGGHPVDKDKFTTLFGRNLEQTKFCISAQPSNSKGNPPRIFPLSGLSAFAQVAQRMGFPLIQCDFEADDEIVVLAKRLHAIVISNDSDFFLYGTPFVLLNSINLNHVQKERYDNGKVSYFIPCYKFNPEKFCEYTKLSRDRIPLLAPLLGNDYIDLDLLSSFHGHVKFLRPDLRSASKRQRLIISVVRWIATRKGSPTEILDEAIEVMSLSDEERFMLQSVLAMYSPTKSSLESWVSGHLPNCPLKGSSKPWAYFSRITQVDTIRNGYLPPNLQFELNCSCESRSEMQILHDILFPKWFIKAYRLYYVFPVVTDMLNQSYIISIPQVECPNMNSMYIPLKSILYQIRGLMWSSVYRSYSLHSLSPEMPLTVSTPYSRNVLPLVVNAAYSNTSENLKSIDYISRDDDIEEIKVATSDSDSDVIIENETDCELDTDNEKHFPLREGYFSSNQMENLKLSNEECNSSLSSQYGSCESDLEFHSEEENMETMSDGLDIVESAIQNLDKRMSSSANDNEMGVGIDAKPSLCANSSSSIQLDTNDKHQESEYDEFDVNDPVFNLKFDYIKGSSPKQISEPESRISKQSDLFENNVEESNVNMADLSQNNEHNLETLTNNLESKERNHIDGAKTKKSKKKSRKEKDSSSLDVNFFKIRNCDILKYSLQNKVAPELKWYIRKSNTLGKVKLNACPLSEFEHLPTLFELEKMPVGEKQKLFRNMSGLNMDLSDQDIPPHLQFILYALCYWLINYRFRDKSLVMTALMSILYFSVLDIKVGRKPYGKGFQPDISMKNVQEQIQSGALLDPQNLSIAGLFENLTKEECQLAKLSLLQFHEPNPFIDEKNFNRSVVHFFSCFQATVYYFQMLNTLLCFPFPYISMSYIWGGTFSYNVYEKLFSRNCGVPMVVSSLFTQNIRVIHMFEKLYSVLQGEIGTLPIFNWHKLTSISDKKQVVGKKIFNLKSPEDLGIQLKKTKKKKKKSIQKLMCDRIANPSEDILLEMAENKFATLLFDVK